MKRIRLRDKVVLRQKSDSDSDSDTEDFALHEYAFDFADYQPTAPIRIRNRIIDSIDDPNFPRNISKNDPTIIWDLKYKSSRVQCFD